MSLNPKNYSWRDPFFTSMIVGGSVLLAGFWLFFVLHFWGGDVAERDVLYLSVVSWDLSQDS